MVRATLKLKYIKKARTSVSIDAKVWSEFRKKFPTANLSAMIEDSLRDLVKEVK